MKLKMRLRLKLKLRLKGVGKPGLGRWDPNGTRNGTVDGGCTGTWGRAGRGRESVSLPTIAKQRAGLQGWFNPPGPVSKSMNMSMRKMTENNLYNIVG
ncbi:hypothetical protein PAAG_04026 [Paracoccidioides lutzii Pb01]|uniref:Uncharacterized protein n=1 Tax=Paracoccidioides lutzii (strain ATCC MYA-826 / Pb01) TaxID=502779 RepID=C1GZT2_PARBA|nr:hypothetical protein PAAG_04026 [Paracoccidioides lutzii Pb01]EEH32973.2 hypothetical protein PAAG_04026 [Paracoccidioides lutzii Pb01]